MAQSIYKKLARHLDRLPGSFPSTESGVELRILKRLFTLDEAEMAMRLNMIPEQSHVIARRAGITIDETEKKLDEMARKGLIFCVELDNRPKLYTASQYVIGIWEYHVNDLDEDLIKDMEEYAPTLTETWKKVPQLRTIPVQRSISVPTEILPYENAEMLVRERKKFLVAPCICRRERKMVGEGCDAPEESCLVFGLAADYYEKNGIGRIIDLQETLDILKKADEAGLVLQPSNAQKIVNICCCCGCCCQILKNLKRHPDPTTLASAPFIAMVKDELCKGCGICVDRCQMNALQLMDNKISLDSSRCIGCGLCVSTCPTGCLSLDRKPESEQRFVPKNMTESQKMIIKARGKPSSFDLAMMSIRSKLDRLLASK